MNTDTDITEHTSSDDAQASSQELKEIIRMRILKHITQSNAKIEDITSINFFIDLYRIFIENSDYKSMKQLGYEVIS